MAVSPEYRAYIMDHLGRMLPIRPRSLFGELGLYSEDRLFAAIADDGLYLKADDESRPLYEAEGMPAFAPGGGPPMSYYRLPEELIEDREALQLWIDRALAAAERAAARKRRPAKKKS